jgi:polyisoprenoid-binding protein YceI
MIRSTVRNTAIVALCIALPGIANALVKIDSAKSSVSAVFKQLNVPVEAKFKKFSAAIDVNTAKPEASKATVEIDIPSFDMGDADLNKEVLKKEWFNAAQFPRASFVSSTVKPAGGGRVDVIGMLTIKGKTIDVSFPVSVRQEGANQIFEGALPIKRLMFNVGEGEWRDTSTVADEVVIKFHIVTSQ